MSREPLVAGASVRVNYWTRAAFFDAPDGQRVVASVVGMGILPEATARILASFRGVVVGDRDDAVVLCLGGKRHVAILRASIEEVVPVCPDSRDT